MKKSFIKFVNGMRWTFKDNNKKSDEVIGSDTGVLYTECDKTSMYVWVGSSGTYDVYKQVQFTNFLYEPRENSETL